MTFCDLQKLQKKQCNASELKLIEKNLQTNFYWNEENILASPDMDRSFAVDITTRIRHNRS